MTDHDQHGTTSSAALGQQHELRHGSQRAVVVEVGGGLRQYWHGDHPVLDGYPADGMAPAARGQLLIPWPNRLHTGRYDWDGTSHTVPVNEPDQQNALHGLTRWRSWTVESSSPTAVTMRHTLRPQPGYPFALELEARYQLDDSGLTVTTRSTNIGDADAPFGYGAHPYLTVGTDVLDEAELQIGAETWLPTGPAQIPIGRESVADTPFDFRRRRAIGKTRLDYTFTDLERDAEGRAWVHLTSPAGREVALWVDRAFAYVELFTGDTLPDVDRRRRGLGVEPMTCPPDAFRTGEDVVRLRPGAFFEAQWGIRAG
ncbi:aldose 1-epimerase family protein [Nocardioides sp. MH1]|uniref:aldose 1-epimerase family protein n=1 Tax=Nocardioides sp. MH1 TaxID=3242490 RepID=UPI0035216BAE